MKINLNIPLFWAPIPIILLRWYAHVYFKKAQALQIYVSKPRRCHTTTLSFLEMCKPKVSTHEDLCGRDTSGRGHQCTSSFFSRRKWSFYPGVYTVSLCTTQTPSNASSGQLTSSTASSYNQTVRGKHTQKNPVLSRSLQMHKHSHAAQQIWVNPPLSGKWESLRAFFNFHTNHCLSREGKQLQFTLTVKNRLSLPTKSHLSPNPEAVVQPQEPFDHGFHTFPLSFPQAAVGEGPHWLLE